MTDPDIYPTRVGPELGLYKRGSIATDTFTHTLRHAVIYFIFLLMVCFPLGAFSSFRMRELVSSSSYSVISCSSPIFLTILFYPSITYLWIHSVIFHWVPFNHAVLILSFRSNSSSINFNPNFSLRQCLSSKDHAESTSDVERLI